MSSRPTSGAQPSFPSASAFRDLFRSVATSLPVRGSPPRSSCGFQLPFLFIGPLPVFDYVTSCAGVTTADLRSLFSVPSLMQADFRSVLSPLPVLRPPRRHVVVFSSTSVFQASPRLPPHPVLHLASLPFLDSTSGGGTHEGGARDAETEQKGRRWR